MRAPRFLAATALALAGACSAASPTPTREASVATALEEGQRELREGRPAEALPALRRALAADPRNLTALRGLIEAHFRHGRLDEVLAEPLDPERRAALRKAIEAIVATLPPERRP